MSRVDLLVDWCDYQAAKYAVEHWHYSKSMPTPPVIKIGVWEDGLFVGCVLFSRGSNNNMLKPFGIDLVDGAELTRIALDTHKSYVTTIVSKCIKLLKEKNPGLRLIVSYADPNESHHGGVYQAGNWIYSGQTSPDCYYLDKQGRRWHSRQVSSTGVSRQYGELRRVPTHDECERIPLKGKHRYLYPLDKAMRRQIEPLAQPYPKRAPVVQIGNTADDQSDNGGSIPTQGLE